MIEHHPELTNTERSALKWVLLCDKYKLDPLETDVFAFEPKREEDR